MSDYYLRGACHIVSNSFFGENRLNFEGVQEAQYAKPGIRFHNFIVAFILRFFGNKIVDIKDIDGKIYSINRGSLADWLKRNDPIVKRNSKEALMGSLTESGIRGILNDFLREKSPQYIVKTASIKFDISWEEEKAVQWPYNNPNGSIADRERPEKIANLKRQLAELDAERAAKKSIQNA